MKTISKPMLYSAWVNLSSGHVLGVNLQKVESGYDLYTEVPVIHGFGSGLLIAEEESDLRQEVKIQLALVASRCETLAAELLNHAVEFSKLAEEKIDLSGVQAQVVAGKPRRSLVHDHEPLDDSTDNSLADLLDELE